MIDFLIIVMYIIMSIALLAITCSVAKRLFLMKQSSGTENRIPKRKIRVAVILSMLAILILTYTLCDVQPIKISNIAYDDETMLRTTNMLVQTGVVAVTVAIACILISALMRVYNNK